MAVRLRVEDVDRELHDARLDLLSLQRDGDELRVSGTVERPTSGRPVSLLGRYPVLLTVFGVEDVTVEDDEGVGELFVQAVTFDSGTLQLESAIPGRIIVHSTSPTFELQVGRAPTEVRRWGRWRAARRR